LVAVRELKTAAPDATAVDTAVFSAASTTYTITANANGSITVNSNGGADGIDTLWNIERLRFTDTTITVAVPAAPTITSLVPGNGSVTVNFTGPASATTFTVRAFVGTDTTVAPLRTVTVAGTATSALVTGLANGTLYTFTVVAVNQFGTSATVSGTATPIAPTAPAAPTIGTATRGNASATVTWTANGTPGAPLSSITSYRVQVRLALTNTLLNTVTVTPGTASSGVVTGLVNGVSYRFQVAAVNAVGTGPFSALSNAVTPATVPGAPIIGTALSGTPGAPINATARWSAPLLNGGSAITGYVVTALQLNAAGAVIGTTVSATQPATATQLVMTLPVIGNYRFTVQAINAVGGGAQSARSNQVAGR
ncbi:MAG: fibronectin type III domain-containing protein, partial [Terrabacter sp.]